MTVAAVTVVGSGWTARPFRAGARVRFAGVPGPAGADGVDGTTLFGGAVLVRPDGTSARYAPAADTDAARGTAAAAAFAAAAAGDQVRLGPGTYDFGGSAVTFPAGASVVGCGRVDTTIKTQVLGGSGFTVNGNDTYVGFLTCLATAGDGFNFTNGPFTGVVLEEADVRIASTGVFVGVSTASEVALRGLRFYSTNTYLAGVRVFAAGAVVRCVNCLWLSSFAPNASFGEVACSAGTLEVVGGAVRSVATRHLTQSGSGVLRVSALDFDPSKTSGTITGVAVTHDGTRGIVQANTGAVRLLGSDTTGGLDVNGSFGLTVLTSTAGGSLYIGPGGIGLQRDKIVLGSFGGANQIDAALTQVLRLYDAGGTAGATLASTPVTPAALSGDVNDYNPGVGRRYRFSTSGGANRNVTGFSIGQTTGQEFFGVNLGPNTVTLKHQNAGSSPANQLICTGGADIVLSTDEEFAAWYDGGTQRFRVRKI